MARTILHTAASRGGADHGWLKSFHTFSFGSYFDPERIQFGALRVLNDDTVDGGKGFGEHPHDNMEIISIPLEGALQHMDSTGNIATIERGEIQAMSAGTGVYHTEYNGDGSKPVKFLQIWLYPNKRNVEPRYDKRKIELYSPQNSLVQVLSPSPDDEGVWIHQDAWFSMGKLKAQQKADYKIRKRGNGAYIFVLEGEITMLDQKLGKRDGFGIWETDGFTVSADCDAELLIMDVPMLY